MKKLLALSLGIILVFSLFALAVSAADTKSYGKVKWVDISKIKIDGTKKDFLLEQALLIEVKDIAIPGMERDNHATGKFWYLWNEAGIYLFAEVKDPTPTNIPPLPPACISSDPGTHVWNRDSFEIFIEANNGDTQDDTVCVSADPKNQSYIFSWLWVDDENKGAPHEQGTKMQGAEKPYLDCVGRYDPNDNTVYYVEMFMKVPKDLLGDDYKYQAGQKVGTVIGINDMDKAVDDFSNAGDRCVYQSETNGGDPWAIADHWYIELSADKVEFPADPGPGPGGNPGTGDGFAIFALMAALALGVVITGRKLRAKAR